MALIGYARVSTRDHTVAAQLDELQKVECARIFEETASEANRDRLARSLKQLIETVEALEDRGIGFRSLTEAIDTTKAGGGLVVQIFGALAEFERGVIRERTRAGLNAARSRGRKGGRPPKLKASDLEAAKALLADREINVEDVARRLGVSPATLYRYIPAARSSVGLVGWAGSEKTSERAPT